MNSNTYAEMALLAKDYLTNGQPAESEFIKEIHNRDPNNFFLEIADSEKALTTIYGIVAKAFHAYHWTEKYPTQLSNSKALASDLIDELNKGPLFNTPAEQELVLFTLNRIFCLSEGSSPVEAERRKDGNPRIFIGRRIRKTIKFDLQQHGIDLNANQFANLCLVVMPDMNYETARLDADYSETDHELLAFNSDIIGINVLYAKALEKYV